MKKKQETISFLIEAKLDISKLEIDATSLSPAELLKSYCESADLYTGISEQIIFLTGKFFMGDRAKWE